MDIHASKIEILKVSNTKREKETSTVSLSNLLQKPDRTRPYRHRPHDLFKCPVRRPWSPATPPTTTFISTSPSQMRRLAGSGSPLWIKLSRSTHVQLSPDISDLRTTTTPGSLETRQYIRDLDRLAETTTTAQELYDKMLELYPDRVNPGWALWNSARAVKP